MSALMSFARRAVSAVVQSSGILSQSLKPQSVKPLTAAARSFTSTVQCTAQYNPYPRYEENPDPYSFKRKIRHGYRYKYYTGGVLPRPKGKYEDTPLPGPRVFPQDRDNWTKSKALFGQNDYIDILGDGQVHPVQLMQGPQWLIGFKGNEIQRLIQRMKFQGRLLKDKFPSKYTSIMQRIFHLYKKRNRRKRAPFWGGKSAASRDRRFRFDKL